MRSDQRPFLSFVDRTLMDRIPPALRDICISTEVGVSGSNLDSVIVRAFAVGSWWICSIEGQGLTKIQSNILASLPTDRVLLSLSRNGRYQSSARYPLLQGANAISLSPMAELQPIISWGDFSYTLFCVPQAELMAKSAGLALPFGRSIPAGAGRGAVLAATLRTLYNETLHLSDPSSLEPLLPDLSGLIITAFLDDGSNPQHSLPKQPIDDILRYLEDHLADPKLCPKQVASACGLSERQLYRHFATQGQSFSLTLRRLRLEKGAQFLIMGKRASIGEIARDCGFSTPLYFSQTFREAYGMSPRDYRDGHPSS